MPPSRAGPLKNHDMGVPCWKMLQTENVRLRHFVNFGLVVLMRIATHCCHSRLDKKARLGTMFFQTVASGSVLLWTFTVLLSMWWILHICTIPGRDKPFQAVWWNVREEKLDGSILRKDNYFKFQNDIFQKTLRGKDRTDEKTFSAFDSDL